MDGTVLAVFGFVYLGMLLGHIPGLRLDRTDVALLGALVFIITGKLDVQAARNAVDLPTMALLFGLMVVSAQLRLGGFYSAITRRIGLAQLSLASTPAGNLFLVGSIANLIAVEQAGRLGVRIGWRVHSLHGPEPASQDREELLGRHRALLRVTNSEHDHYLILHGEQVPVLSGQEWANDRALPCSRFGCCGTPLRH